MGRRRIDLVPVLALLLLALCAAACAGRPCPCIPIDGRGVAAIEPVDDGDNYFLGVQRRSQATGWEDAHGIGQL